MNLKGMGVALATPFHADFSVDDEALKKLVDFQIDGGADFLLVLGTTAETPTLSKDERARITSIVAKQNACRVPLILGMGGNNTMGLIEEIKTTDLSQVDAILSVVPYYNKPTQEGIYQHFRAVAQASPKPVVLYNVPGRTGTNMKAETTLRLAREFSNIIAVKEASGKFDQIEEIIKNKPEHFNVVSGDDSSTFPLIELGADGVFSVIGNAYPEEFSKMVHVALAGDMAEARKLHYELSGLMDLLFVDGNPAGIKRMLFEKGLIENVLRLPLVPTTEQTNEKIKMAMKKLPF